MNVDDLLLQMKERYATERISTIDGVKIDFDRVLGSSKKIKYRTYHPNLY